MGSPFCAICDKEDNESNLRAAGRQGATKDAKLTEWWKDMVTKTNNSSLLAKVATGILPSKELFYHLDCYSSRNYQ